MDADLADLAAEARSASFARGALLLLQLVVGYEWFVSGLTKIAHRDFPSGLAADLADRAQSSPRFYASFLREHVIPQAQAFGYLIEWAELVSGAALIVAAALLLFWRPRLSLKARRPIYLAIAIGALIGLVLAINLELANGARFGRPPAADSFDEGVDLDTMMLVFDAVLLGWALAALRLLHARRALVTPAADAAPAEADIPTADADA